MTISPAPEVRFDLDLVDDPWLDRLDLDRFEHLPEQERRRIIIRVLCGLVALGVTDHQPTVPAPTHGADVAVTAHPVDPGPLRRLPFLGLEVHGARKRTRAAHRSIRMLPFLGREHHTPEKGQVR